MGVIKRQTIKNSIVNFSSIFIGGISSIYIYPLNWELIGKIQFIMSSAILMSAFLSMGSFSIPAKFNPSFQKDKIKGLLGYIIILATSTIIFWGIICYFSFTPFVVFMSNHLGFDSTKFIKHLPTIFAISSLLAYTSILRAQSSSNQRIVIPDIITVFSFKLFLPIILLLIIYKFIHEDLLALYLISFHLFAIVLLVLYLHRIGCLNISFRQNIEYFLKKFKAIFTYMSFNTFNHLGNILAYKTDLIMVSFYCGFASVGYYSFFLFMANVIDIPSKALTNISSPIISKLLEEGNISEVEKIYKKSSSSLLIASVLLFSLIWMNSPNLFLLMTNGTQLINYQSVFLLLGITKIIDMITSINSSIISFSRFYRYNTLFIVLLGINNIGLNIFFIPQFGLTGVAMATSISMILYNIIKTLFVFMKYNIHPFHWKYIFIICLGVVGYFLNQIFIENYLILDILIKSIIFSIIYIKLTLILNISDDFNTTIKSIYSKTNFNLWR